jgi:hypothetical protein
MLTEAGGQRRSNTCQMLVLVHLPDVGVSPAVLTPAQMLVLVR